ncbi:MAG: hypothetical protein AB7P22_00985 [Vicinamibacterales bacterium]
MPIRRRVRQARETGLPLMHPAIAICCALILAAPGHASAQVVVQAFEDLALRVNLDDHLRVQDESGRQAAGRLTSLTPDEIAILTESGERRFTHGTVREVAVRGYALKRGALIGAVVFAVLGVAAMCAHGEENCALIGSLAAAPGAGVGLAVGALVPRMRPVYRGSTDRVSEPASAGGVQAGFLSDLALRANLDDQIEVEDRSGVRTIGRLTHLAGNEIAVRTDVGEKRFTRDTVRQVAVRRRPLRMAVLVGAGAAATAAAVAACKGPDREECADAPMLAAGLGAGLGLAVGAVIHRTAVVYPEPDRKVFVLPLISRDAVGVRVSRRW